MMDATKNNQQCTCSERRGLWLNYQFQADPTRTINLRNQFLSEVNRRFEWFKRILTQAIVDKDVLALRPSNIIYLEQYSVDEALSRLRSRQFDFARADQKANAFMGWMKELENDGLLEVTRRPGSGRIGAEPWTDMYVRSAYQKGVSRGRAELRKAGYDVPRFAPEEGQDVAMSLNQPIHAERAAMAYTRTFTDLKGITEAMDAGISRELSEGLIAGMGPKEIARNITNMVDNIGRNRAKTLARTEVIRAHHMATMGEYRQARAEGLTVKAEWSTSGFNVCPICEALEGQVFSLDEAERMLPAHPNCRCCMLPAGPEFGTAASREKDLVEGVHGGVMPCSIPPAFRSPQAPKIVKPKAKPKPSPPETPWLDDPVAQMFKNKSAQKQYWEYKQQYLREMDEFGADKLRSAANEFETALKTEGYAARDNDVFREFLDDKLVVQEEKWVSTLRGTIGEWQENPSHELPVAFKMQAAKVEKGLPRPRVMAKRGIDADMLDYVKEDLNGLMPLDDYLRMRAFNQAYMETIGVPDEITVYRGTEGGTGMSLREQLEKKGLKTKLTMTDDSLAGYSGFDELADSYGLYADGVSIRRVVRREDIVLHRDLICGQSGAFTEENEFILRGLSKVDIDPKDMQYVYKRPEDWWDLMEDEDLDELMESIIVSPYDSTEAFPVSQLPQFDPEVFFMGAD